MTDAANQPTGKGTEGDKPAAQPVEHSKAFAEILALTHTSAFSLAHAEKPADKPADKPAAKPADAPHVTPQAPHAAIAAPHPTPEITGAPKADNRGIVQSFGHGAAENALGMVKGMAQAVGGHEKTSAEIDNEMKHNLGTGGRGNFVGAIASTAWNLFTNAPQIAKGIGSSAIHAKDVIASGTANQRAELAGSLTVGIGTMFIGGAAAKATTEARTVEVAEGAYKSIQGARAGIGEYAQTARTVTTGALKTSETRAAEVAAARPAAEIARPVSVTPRAIAPEAAPHVAPEVAPKIVSHETGLSLPKIEPRPTIAEPSLMNRLVSRVTSPFKSLVGTPEGAVVDNKSLATRLDGLKPAANTAESKLAPRVGHPNIVSVVEEPRATSLQHPIKVDRVVEPPAVIKPVEGKAAEVHPVAQPVVKPVEGKAAEVHPVAQPVVKPVEVKAAEVHPVVKPAEAHPVVKPAEVPPVAVKPEATVPVVAEHAALKGTVSEAVRITELTEGAAAEDLAVGANRSAHRADVGRVNAGPTNVEAAHVELTHIEPTHIEPTHIEPAHVELAPARADATIASAAHDAPNLVASQARQSLDNLSHMAREHEGVMSPAATQALDSNFANLSRNLDAVARNGEGALSAASRKELSDNLSAVERAFDKSGRDASIDGQLAELKQSVEKLTGPKAAEAELGTVKTIPADVSTASPRALRESAVMAPSTASPAIIARETAPALQDLGRAVEQSGVKLTPEAEKGLANLRATFDGLTKTSAETITPQAARDASRDLALVERSLTSSGADAGVMEKFGQVKSAVSDIGKSSAERVQIAAVKDSVDALEAQGSKLSASAKNLNQALDRHLSDTPGLSAADQRLAQEASQKLVAIDQKVAEGGLAKTPVQTAADLQNLARELEAPEYSRLFADNPQAARALEEMQTNVSAMANTSSKVEAAQVGVNGLKRAEVLEAGLDGAGSLTQKFKATLPAGEASKPIARTLDSIEQNLASVKSGTSAESALNQVSRQIETLESQGATDMARQLRESIAPAQDASIGLERAQRLENSITTISREGTALEGQTAKLADSFSTEARTTASTGGALPVNAQVADQLTLISRQSRLLDAGEGGVGAVAKIKDAFTRVEDLTSGQALSVEQQTGLREIKQSIGRIDQASVEASGLRRLEANSGKIVEQTSNVQALTGRISKSVDVAGNTASDAALEQKLNTINRTAQEVRAAKTIEDQASAASRLASSVQDSELQTALSRSPSGMRALDELKSTTAELHESVSYRAFERAQATADVEALNGGRVAERLENRLARDPAVTSAPNANAIQTAVSDYRQAAQSFAGAADRSAAATQIEQKFNNIQTQLRLTPATSALADGEELAALKQSQLRFGQAAADSDLIGRSLIDRRLPVVEDGFDKIAHADSSLTQRDLMGRMSDQIQSLRYLESRTTGGAVQLDNAQTQLTRAQNDLEVAAYRNNLVKMAASGDRSASDKLLISGLTSDGFKITNGLATADPASRLIADFAKSRLPLLPGTNNSLTIRSLASSDPIFTNNPGWLSANAMRNAGYAMVGFGAATALTGGVREELDRENALKANTDNSLQVVPQSPDASLRTIGRGAEITGFTPNGQALARQAFAHDVSQQSLPRLSGTAGSDAGSFNAAPLSAAPFNASAAPIGSDAVVPSNSYSLSPYDNSSLSRTVVPQIGPFMLDRYDPDLAAKLHNISISGTLYGVKKGSDAISLESIITPLSTAQSLQLRSTAIRSTDSGRLDKLATSMFAIPSTQLSSPNSLLYGQRRDLVSARGGNGTLFGGAAGAARTNDASMRASNSLSADADADAQEGGVSAGTKNLKHVEHTESTGIDSNASHAVSASAAPSMHDDEDEHGNDPHTVSSTAGGASPVNPVNTSGSASVARRVPSTGDKSETVGQTTTPAAQSPLAAASTGIGAPPRKRVKTDAISA